MKGGRGRRWNEGGGGGKKRSDEQRKTRDIIPFSSFLPRGCDVISTKIFLVLLSLHLLCVYSFTSVCFLSPHTHAWTIIPQSLHPLPFSRPHKPQAMSEMCHTLCVCACAGRAKPPWHTKGGERCYLVSELSLCLPYISAPKPHRLSITERRSLLPREKVLETP